MRVLWWTYDFWPSIGGGEVIGAELALGLKGRGHELSVVTQEVHGLTGHDSFDGIPVARFPFHPVLAARDPETIAHLLGELRRLIHDFRPDLVHLHTLTHPAFFCARTMAGSSTPLLLTRHELFPPATEPPALTSQVMERASWVAGCSAAVLEDVRSRFPEMASRSSAILNGLAAPREPPSPPTFDPPLLLCLGRLAEQKGFHLALDALPRVRSRFSDVRLIMAGEGPAGNDLKARAARLGVADSVDFCGWIPPPRVFAAIQRASLVLVPSLHGEAFGLVALQAAQMARPVVAARTGGLPEIVVDGETGLLFEPGDAAGLARAVVALLARPDLARAWGEAGRARALEQFSGERHLDQYDRLYGRLAGS